MTLTDTYTLNMALKFQKLALELGNLRAEKKLIMR